MLPRGIVVVCQQKVPTTHQSTSCHERRNSSVKRMKRMAIQKLSFSHGGHLKKVCAMQYFQLPSKNVFGPEKIAVSCLLYESSVFHVELDERTDEPLTDCHDMTDDGLTVSTSVRLISQKTEKLFAGDIDKEKIIP